MDDFKQFILKHKNNNAVTHNSKYDPKGTFSVNDNEIDSFNKLYINALKDKQPIYINETMNKYTPIVIDIDILYLKSEIINNRIYSSIIDKFIEITIKIINKHVIVDDNKYLLFLFEKNSPSDKDTHLKDGFHIILPFICIYNKLLYIIRDDIINELEDIKLFDTIPHINTIDNIYDKNPYVQSTWLMHGSIDLIKSPYILTKIYTKDLELQSFNYTTEELVNLLSVRKINNEYIASTVLSEYEIMNKYKVLDNQIILKEFLNNNISDEHNFNYRNSRTNLYYNIRDIPKFYTYLYNSLNDGSTEYLTQKTKEYGPIISDIDIYYEDSSVKKIYPPEFITIISDVYIKIVKKYVNVSEKNIQIFVLEKDRIPIMTDLYKDGLHLIMPYICLTQENQHFIRLKVIEEVAKLDIFENEQLDRIFDKMVIQNYWTVYGCCNQDRCKYLLSHIFDSNLNSIDITQYSLRDLINILNITKFTSDQINTMNIKETFVNIKNSSSRNKLFNIILIITLIILIINFYKK